MPDDVLYMKFCLESFERYLRKIGIYRDWNQDPEESSDDDAVGREKTVVWNVIPNVKYHKDKFKTVWWVGAGIYLRTVNDFPEQNQKDSLS